MFRPALKRLFLVLFPILLFMTALYLTYTYPKKQTLTSQQHNIKPCPFYLGVSFFSQKEKFQPKQLTTYTLSEKFFTKKIQNLRRYFKKNNISLKQVFFALPLTLTKEEDWIVSEKTFFILPTGERKQISHLTYFEINHFHKRSENSNDDPINSSYQALKLNKILSSLPKKSNFLFYLLGSNRKATIKNLNKIQDKIQGRLYLSSPNEKLLKDLLLYQSCSNSKNLSKTAQFDKKDECLAEASSRRGLPLESLKQPLKNNIKILHSFKTLIRLEILSIFPYLFEQIRGDGLIAPNNLPLDQKSLHLLKQEGKLLFFEKDPPYSLEDKKIIQKSQALISSQIKLAISSIKDKKTCLLKN